MPFWWDDWGMGFHVLHGIGSLTLLAILVVGVVWLARSGAIGRRSTALDILETRYARGEIGRDEYLQKKTDLQK
jgi:putative membrane protein